MGATDLPSEGDQPTQIGAEDEASASRARAHPPMTPGSVIGRYVVLSCIGAGGMGVVYAAHDPELDRKVALKVLRPGHGDPIRRARLLREAQALARLAHPNVVTVHDVGTHAEQVWIAMEFIEGVTLTTWLAERPRGPAEVLAVFVQATSGVVAAHTAGLLHRDLKPDNIMVGTHGRVWVMDFGLARSQDDSGDVPRSGDGSPEASRTGASSSAVQTANLTEDGALVGTPAYMAPEQFTGRPVDARTDQFSLCVALWEALYGERPFAGVRVHELCVSITGGKRRPPPRGARVPAWLRSVCERGLAVEPDARFPSVHALQLALLRGRAVARWRLGATVAVLLGGGVAATWAWSVHAEQQRRAACDAEGGSIDAVWGERARDQLRAVMVAADAEAADRVTPWLDRYAHQWHEARADACARVDVDPTWSTDLLDRARWCLDERRSQLEALVANLASGAPQAVSRAVPAAANLPSLAPCGDRAALERMPLPSAQQRAHVEAIRTVLAAAEAQLAAGSYDEAHTLAQDALGRAELLEWPPLVATSRATQGAALVRRGRYAEAERALEDAYFEAMDAGAIETGAEAAIALTAVTGRWLARPVDGLRWSRLALLALRERGLEHGGKHAALLASEAEVHTFAGDHVQAQAGLEQALVLRERELGPEHPGMAALYQQLAVLHATRGDYAGAKPLFERAAGILSDALGPSHPLVAGALNNLGNVHRDLGDYPQAKALHERALAIKEARLGPDHPDVAISLENLGLVTQTLGDLVGAERLFERAIAIHERALGREHPTVAHDLTNLALVFEATGDHTRARALLERALAIDEKVLGPSHPQLAQVLNNLGLAHLALAEFDVAQSRLERAAAIVEAEFGPEHPNLAHPLVGLAQVALARSRPADALPFAERALRLREGASAPAEEQASARALVARALFESGGDRARARSLADAALVGFRSVAPARANEREELEAWMAAHDLGTASPP